MRPQGRLKSQSIVKSKGIVHKRPFIIGIGGSRSGAGKTTVAEVLLRHLTQGIKVSRLRRVAEETRHQGVEGRNPSNPRTLGPLNPLNSWGAIKYTKTAIYSSIVDDPQILLQKDKDTEKLLRAGAANVLWVQSPAEELKEVLPLAVDRLSHLTGIIIEGNSAIEFLKPDIVIFIFGKDDGAVKKSADKILNMADIILFQKEPLMELPAKAKKIRIDISLGAGLDECIKYISKLLK